MIQQEVEDWLAKRAHLQDEEGRRQMVRNGFLPKREISYEKISDQPPKAPEQRKPLVTIKLDTKLLGKCFESLILVRRRYRSVPGSPDDQRIRVAAGC
jgi:hypothetical protein